MKMNKKVLLGFLLLTVGLLAYLVMAASPYGTEVLSSHNLSSGMNVSKQINLTATFFGAGTSFPANSSIENVTFIFQLVANFSTSNVTFNNISGNQTFFWGYL